MNSSIKSLFQYGSSYVFIKYAIVLIGFIRSIVVASILSVYEMGLLAFFYLLIEYITTILPIGSINSVNKQISNLRADNNKLDINDRKTYYIYNSSIFLLFILFVLAASFIFVIDTHIYSLLPVDIIKSKFLFFLIIIFSIYRALANMHNRLWQNYKRLFMSELSYALIYLVGIYIFLGSGDDYIIILNVLVVSLISSILLAGYFPNLKKLNMVDTKSIKLTLGIGFFLMCYITMEQLFWGIDRFFIASILEPEQLAVFHISHTFGRGVLMFYAAITFLFYPILLTFYSNKIYEVDKFSSIMINMSRFSETIMILALLAAIIVIPHFVNVFLPQYQDISTLLFVVLLGLILKGLAFFPSSYFIAISWQRNLTLISLVFIIIIGLTYFIAGKIFSLHAYGYTAIAIVVFFVFLITLMMILQKKVGSDNSLFFIIKIYYKMFITLVISLFFLSSPNYLSIINNIDILCILIVFLYLNNIITMIKKVVYALMNNDVEVLFKSFIKID